MKLEFAHIHRLPGAHQVDFHCHSALEIVYFSSGCGTTTQDGRTYEISQNCFSITPAGTRHNQVNHQQITSFCTGISNSGLDAFSGFWIDAERLIKPIMERLFGELQTEGLAKEMMLDGLIRELVVTALRVIHTQISDDQKVDNGSFSPKPRQKELVERAMQLIREEQGQLTVTELSEQLFVSHDYLRHLFQEYAGKSPMRHIIESRINHAKMLLLTTDLKIADIASRTGFESPYYFSRLFKQVTNRTPTAFRSNRG